MAYTDPCDAIIAKLTDSGRSALARLSLGELSFILESFAVGMGGYNPANPVHTTTIDTSLTELELQIYPSGSGHKLIDSIERPDEQCILMNCRLADVEGNYGLGETGVWAKVVYSNIPAEIGTTFLFAVAHMPLQSKTYNHVYLERIIIQF